jgi:hypothetical protein
LWAKRLQSRVFFCVRCAEFYTLQI